MNNFNPQTEITVPHGEGALEAVFACLERTDPTFQHFTTILIRDPEKERYPSLDQIPSSDCELRGPIVLPPPPTRPPSYDEARSLPGTLKVFDHRNASDVGSFLYSLHHAIHRAANFHTYAVLVLFRPPAVQIPIDGCAAAPTRLFSGSPTVKSVCLLAASGNRLAFYSAADAKKYFLGCVNFIRSDAIDEYCGTEVSRLLRYLDFNVVSRHTLDVALPYDPYLRDTDDESKSIAEHVVKGPGYGVYAFPVAAVNRYHYEKLRDYVFDTYLSWLDREEDHRVFFGSPLTFRFMRTRQYLIDRYPTLRDWLIKARTGNNTPNCPAWPSLSSMVDLINQEPQDDGCGNGGNPVTELAAEADDHEIVLTAPKLYAPNYLSAVAENAYMLLRRVFTERCRLKELTSEEGEREIEHLLCDSGVEETPAGETIAVGLLMHLLAEISDIPTQTVVELRAHKRKTS